MFAQLESSGQIATQHVFIIISTEIESLVDVEPARLPFKIAFPIGSVFLAAHSRVLCLSCTLQTIGCGIRAVSVDDSTVVCYSAKKSHARASRGRKSAQAKSSNFAMEGTLSKGAY
jgi:hypothetical protein